jgi:hypothetical protein
MFEVFQLNGILHVQVPNGPDPFVFSNLPHPTIQLVEF